MVMPLWMESALILTGWLVGAASLVFTAGVLVGRKWERDEARLRASRGMKRVAQWPRVAK